MSAQIIDLALERERRGFELCECLECSECGSIEMRCWTDGAVQCARCGMFCTNYELAPVDPQCCPPSAS